MPDRILAAVRSSANPRIVVASMKRPVVKFNNTVRGRVVADGVTIAFSEVTELELPTGTKIMHVEELDQESPLVFVEDAA